MRDFEDPAYILDYRKHPDPIGTLSCSNLVTLIRGGPGEKKEREVYVVPSTDPNGKPIKATATIMNGTITVVPTIGDGKHTFTADADVVLRAVAVAHPTKNW